MTSRPRLTCLMLLPAVLAVTSACDKKKDEAKSQCPRATALSEVKHEQAGSVVGTLDASKFVYATAKEDPKKTHKLRIFVATRDWPADELGTLPNPVNEDDDALVVLSILGEEGSSVGAGTYEATSGLDSPINAEIWTKDMVTSLFLGEGSSITIDSTPGGEVCGSVDVMGIFEGDKTRIRGSFAAKRE